MVTTGMRYAVSKLFVKLRLQNIQYFWENFSLLHNYLAFLNIGNFELPN